MLLSSALTTFLKVWLDGSLVLLYFMSSLKLRKLVASATLNNNVYECNIYHGPTMNIWSQSSAEISTSFLKI